MKWLFLILRVGWFLAVLTVLVDSWGKLPFGEYAVVVVLALESAMWHWDMWEERKRQERLSNRMDRVWRR